MRTKLNKINFEMGHFHLLKWERIIFPLGSGNIIPVMSCPLEKRRFMNPLKKSLNIKDCGNGKKSAF